MTFEENYIAIRDKEGRILSVSDIKKLPYLDKGHPLSEEWKSRAAILDLFENYLEKRSFSKAIDVGCGNGWFSNRLTKHVGQVVGNDVNNYELEQAVRIFVKPNLKFVKTDDVIALIKRENPDLVIFNASLQYFNPRENVLLKIKESLKPGSEIHILNTPVHLTRKNAVKAAIKSKQYYTKMGFPEMNFYYFHYAIEYIPMVEWLYRPPRGIMNFFATGKSAHPWGRVRK